MDHKDARRRYDVLVGAVKAALDAADPIGLFEMGAPNDEYGLEVGTIVPRVAKATDLDEVTRIVHKEFVRWFDRDIAGPIAAYEAPAREIWQAVLLFRGEEPDAGVGDCTRDPRRGEAPESDPGSFVSTQEEQRTWRQRVRKSTRDWLNARGKGPTGDQPRM
jgi:hypothetical protein